MTGPLHTDVAIAGGGLVGTSAALAMRARGLSVVLLERDHCGAHSSGINYGGVRRQGRPPEQLPLANAAHVFWRSLKARLGTACEYDPCGHLKLATSAEDMASLERYAARVQDFGLDLELLDAGALRRRYPWISAQAVGGSLCPGDGHANPRLVTPAVAAAARQAGATILEGEGLETAERDGAGFRLQTGTGREIRCAFLVNCAGAWAGRIAETLGEPIAVDTVHPTMLVTEPVPPMMTASIGVEGGGLYARQVARGNCVIGGGRGYALDDTRSRPGTAGITPVAQRAVALFPALREARVLRSWSGTEAMTPDRNPVIGPSATTPGLLHGFGFSGGGFQIAPAVGEALAALADSGESRFDLSAFSIERPCLRTAPRKDRGAA